MANYMVDMILTLTDANGDTARMSVPLGQLADTNTLANLATTATGAITALGAPGVITNAKVTSLSFNVLFEKANPTGALDAQFSSVSDGARLNFNNSVGQTGVSTIPAPVPGVFGTAPNEDVVLVGGAAAAWIAFYVAHASRDSTHNIDVYNGGMKVGRSPNKRAQHKVG